jgi:PAT family acetyl-CoA transporter-like MFS transporter 1
MPLKIGVGFVYHKYFSKYNYEYYGYVQGLRLVSCSFAIITIFLVEVI